MVVEDDYVIVGVFLLEDRPYVSQVALVWGVVEGWNHQTEGEFWVCTDLISLFVVFPLAIYSVLGRGRRRSVQNFTELFSLCKLSDMDTCGGM